VKQPVTDPLIDPVTFAHGCGEQRAKALNAMGIHTIEELLYHVPRRYEDRSAFLTIDKLRVGDQVSVKVIVEGVRLIRLRGRRSILEVVVKDSSPAKMSMRWFNVPYFNRFFTPGDSFVFFGKVKLSGQRMVMDHPDYEKMETDDEDLIHLSRITPIHPASDKISARVLRTLIFHLLDSYGDTLEDYIPKAYRTSCYDTLPLAEAVKNIHFPESFEALERARSRLAYNEFFLMGMVIGLRRRHLSKVVKTPRVPSRLMTEHFIKALPYELTVSQKRVISEIEQDLRSSHPMNRLLQGDVGSGKTVVAAHALLQVLEAGYQGALMAPTEILAEQHYGTLLKWFTPLNVKVHLLTGSRKTVGGRGKKKNEEGQAQLLSNDELGTPQIFVGTHALFQDNRAYDRLGLIVIDEQHKFGVSQRAALTSKAIAPDILIMTATPIPRTLSMTLYGDLDVSFLHELPQGRGEIVTALRGSEKLPQIFDFIKKEVKAGRQAFIVYPLIDESEKLPVKAVLSELEKITKALAPHQVGLLHGRMKSDEKNQVMTQFRNGDIQVLVATTVVEVGVDVPNASIMLIENAERFGLSQLHQLRGRVGRGPNKSYCILVADLTQEDTVQRLKIMESTGDGFRIAEEDLKRRGPGNIFGTEQSGLPPLKVADLIRDSAMIPIARSAAERLLASDPTLAHPTLSPLKRRLTQSMGAQIACIDIG